MPPTLAAPRDAGAVAEDARVGLAPSSGAATALALLGCWLVITAAWWTLALAPVADPPPWLRAARSVCFGSTASGLPDTYGWLLLVAAPGTMLAAIAVTWSKAIGQAYASLRRRRAGRAMLAALALFVVTGVAAASLRISEGLAIDNASFDPAEAGALPAAYPRLDAVVPPLVLVDQEGRPFTNDDLNGRVTLFTFAFAHCHTVCPAIVQTLRSVAARLGDRSPDIVVLTLDPWRDTPGRLAQMHADWQMPRVVRVLSGNVDDVTATLDGFRVPWKRDEATGDVSHPALVYAVGADGRIAYGFNNPSVDWLVEASARLGHDAATEAGAH